MVRGPQIHSRTKFYQFLEPHNSGNTTPRGRGRGGRGGQFSGPNSGTTTPNRGRGRGGRGDGLSRGHGHDSPRGRGRGGQADSSTGGRRGQFGIGSPPRGGGRGAGGRRPDTLSGLLYQERPFLRPIKFVPSVLTKVLFNEESEELLKPGVEEVDEREQSHIPTAEKVFRVFSGRNIPRMESDDEEDNEEQEEIEEVDFNDVGKLFNPTEEIKTTTIRKSKLVESMIIHEEQFTGFYIDPNPSSPKPPEEILVDQPISIDADVDGLTKMVEETLSTTDEHPNVDDVDMSAPQSEAEESETTFTSATEAIAVDISALQTKPEIIIVDVPVPQIEELSTSAPPIPAVSSQLEAIAIEQTESISIQTTEHPETIAVEIHAPQAEAATLETTPPVAAVSPQPDVITADPEPDLFCIDVQPTSVPAEMAPSSDLLPSALRADDEDDDIIVYVAPHPRKTDAQTEETTPQSPEKFSSNNVPDTSRFMPYIRPAALPATPPVASSSSAYQPAANALSTFSFSFSQNQTPSKGDARLIVPPVSTPRQAKAWKRKRGGVKNRMKSSFGAFGAMREEAMLHRSDPRRHERRRGDSDLEWGDSDDDGEVDDVEVALEDFMDWKGKGKETETTPDKGKARDVGYRDDDHGMDVDSDLAPNMAAMKNFVGGLLGNKAGQHTTMDDLRVEDMIKMEDEQDSDNSEDDNDESSEDESVEDALAAEEAMLISESLEFDDEPGNDNSDDDDDDADDQTPRTSFQARLERLRNKARSRKMQDTSLDQMDEDDDEDEDDDMIKRNLTWADQDEEFIQEIEDIFDDNGDALTGKNRKLGKALFGSIRNDTSNDLDDCSPAKKQKDKAKGLPRELQDIWEKDRQKKAEYKKAREAARFEQAADPLSKKKGGKKGRKAMIAAAKLDPTIIVIPNRIVDMTTLVQQIRRFITEIGGPNSMSLPPTNKETRKNIHEMAVAFNLKSLSKGKGDSRYTTLSKTSRTGLAVDERKVAKIVRRSGGMGARGDSFIYDKKGKGPPAVIPRHREGDEVGKAAPKLTESNIGFRMLAMMGWSEGDRIGITGGLEAPLTAIIKTTKLGLGATK
ncbi:hypothetical protein CVT25_003558 [Psilocybe cyanescens]|uniref:Protein SQS1 n=1 Tax=Psilocybe cyanescens TaxID=93625 RepID=A0A409WNW8_PSICY|nr:hypothetical protein CVT25_003558 [Psilocybe cyanescens]